MRIGIKVGPLYASTRVGGSRRRSSSSGHTSYSGGGHGAAWILLSLGGLMLFGALSELFGGQAWIGPLLLAGLALLALLARVLLIRRSVAVSARQAQVRLQAAADWEREAALIKEQRGAKAARDEAIRVATSRPVKRWY